MTESKHDHNTIIHTVNLLLQEKGLGKGGRGVLDIQCNLILKFTLLNLGIWIFYILSIHTSNGLNNITKKYILYPNSGYYIKS